MFQLLHRVLDAAATVTVASETAVLASVVAVSACVGLLFTRSRRRRQRHRDPRPVSYRPQPLQRWEDPQPAAG